MGKIVISENTTLDGVVQDPTGEDGLNFGGWFNQISDGDRQAWAAAGLEEDLSASALLLGRMSDAWFSSRWIPRAGVWADRLNTMAKYVVSKTLRTAKWGNSTILSGDLATEIAKLKREIDGDIVLIGSTQLAHALWELDLVDELRVKIFSIVAGDGRRLFSDNGSRKAMRLLSTQTLGESIIFSKYARARY